MRRWWVLSSGVDFTVASHCHLHYHFQVILAVFVVVRSSITIYTTTGGGFWQGSW